MYRISNSKIDVTRMSDMTNREKIFYIIESLGDCDFTINDQFLANPENCEISDERNIIFYNTTNNPSVYEGLTKIMYHTKYGRLVTIQYYHFFLEELKAELNKYIRRYRDSSTTDLISKISINLNKDNIFERNNLQHITVSGWIVTKDLSRALLIHHKKLNMWLQPGGHCDGNSNILMVLEKEIKEETGLTNFQIIPTIFDVNIHTIEKDGDVPRHEHFDIRFMVITQDENIVLNDESTDYRWITKSEPLEEFEQGVKNLILKWASS